MQVEHLLQQCTVKITVPGGWGTGFFVARGLILTCAHVVKGLVAPNRVRVRWQQQLDFAEAELVQCVPELDLALLQFTSEDADLPCVYLDEGLQVGQDLYFFGYPDADFEHGCPVTGNCEGFTGDMSPLIKFKQAQVRPGMSGSALLNRQTGKVCGMVKFTRDRSIDLGGGAIPARVILEQFPELRELQREFHEKDRRWVNLIAPQPGIDLQSYLNSVVTTYEKWWQYYTLTDAEGKQRQKQESAPIVDFGLTVQTVPKQSQGQPEQEKEKVERFSVLDGLRKYALGEKPEPVLLVGRSGSGKSTALARLMLEEAMTALTPSPSPNTGRGEPKRIPVLVELRYWQGSVDKLILNGLKRHDLAVASDQLESVLKQSLLLFDGVNELPSEDARTQLSAFRHAHPNVPMIFTTRDLSLGGDLGIERKLEMQPLTEAQMQQFIRAYIPGQAEAMLGQLKDRLREFGQTPLLLWMLCEVFQQAPNNQLPSNLGGIFQVFTQTYEASSIRKHDVALLKGDVKPLSDRRLWKQALMAIAAIMMQGKTPVDFRVAIHRDDAEKELRRVFPNERFPVRDILDDLLKYHLLQNHSADQIEFRHQLIQEYYAAEYLRGLLQPPDGSPGLSDEQLKRDYLNYLKWTEPLALMLALVDDEDQALRVLKLAIDEVDLMLGARLAGEVKPGLQATTVGWLDRLDLPLRLKVQCWKTTQSKMAIPGLLKALEHPDSDVCKSAADALGQLRSIEAFLALSHALEDALEYELKSPDYFVHRRSIADAFWQFGSIEAIPELPTTLEDQNTNIRWKVAITLGELGAVEELLKALKYPNANIRGSAAEVLGRLGRVEAIPELVNAFKDLDPWVSGRAVSALGKLGAIEELLKAHEHPNTAMSFNAALSLGKLGCVEAIPTLLKALEHPESSIRGRAAEVLGKLGVVEAIPDLLNLLKDPDNHVHGSVAIALGSLGCVEAIPALLKALEHPESSIRGRAAETLGHLGSSKPLAELWRQQLTSSYTDAYSAIAAIQNRCKFYNHEIWQAAREAEKLKQPPAGPADQATNQTTNIFPNATEVRIFEQVDHYHTTSPIPPDSPS